MQPNTPDRLLKPEILGRIPLLSSLSAEQLEGVTGDMRIKRYVKGEHVISKGSTSDALMFLLAGSLQAVDYTEDGKEVGLNLFQPGSFFGELALIDGHPRSASIVAIEPAAVAFLPREQALRLIYGNPAIAEEMLKHFARSVRSMTELRGLLSIPNTQQRLYALLCHLKRPQHDGRTAITNLPTQRQMAIMINTTRETVSRAMALLEREQIIEKRARILVVKQPDRLAAMAEAER